MLVRLRVPVQAEFCTHLSSFPSFKAAGMVSLVIIYSKKILKKGGGRGAIVNSL